MLSLQKSLFMSLCFSTLTATAQTPTITTPAVPTVAEKIALTEAQKLNLSLLILATVTEQRIGTLVKVDEKVAARYENLKSSYIGGFPTTVAGLAALYLGKESSKRVEFIIAPLTALLRQSYEGSVASSKAIDRFSQITGLDVVLRRSSAASEKSIEYVILPVLRILINRYTALSSAAVSASSVFAGSVYFLSHDSRDAMSSSTIRSLLGQEKVMSARVESLLNDVTNILALDGRAQARLKKDIFDEALRQGLAHNFSDDTEKYSLDVLSLLKNAGSIPAETATAVERLRYLAQDLGAIPAATVRQSTLENVDMALGLAALLETQLSTGRITTPGVRAEMQRMLGGVTQKLMLIGYNLKQ